MTVIIAALCEDRTKAVVAADRMVVFHGRTLFSAEYDGIVSKIHKLHNTAILHTGEFADAEAVISEIEHKSKDGKLTGAGIYDALCCSVTNRIKLRKEQYLKAELGADVDLEGLGRLALASNSGRLREVWTNASEISCGTFIAANVDSNQCSLHKVPAPQTSHETTTSFLTDGSGYGHAQMFLASMYPTDKSSLAEVMFQVYCAKKAAELSEGVGKMTDMAILSSDGLQFISRPLMKELKKMRKKRRRLRRSESERITSLLPG